MRVLWIFLAIMVGHGIAYSEPKEDIRLIQELLAQYGAGTPDGVAGQKTRSAIRAYQADWGIPQDGKISNELKNRLVGDHPDTSPQWMRLKNQDCDVWVGHPEPQSFFTWTGSCIGEKANGSGLLTWTYVRNGTIRQETYTGTMKDGMRSGQGSLKKANGDVFEGSFLEDLPDGSGTYTWTSGDKYEGEYRHGLYDGQGVFDWSNGDRYEGTFRDGMFHGEGKYVWASGGFFEGEFREDLANGAGIWMLSNGDRLEGKFVEGVPDGAGIYTAAGQSVEQRVWEMGCSRGSPNRVIGRPEASCEF